MAGYPYQVAFSAANNNYQIQDLPSGATYVNVGSAVPLTNFPMTVSADTTINFKPNGMVTATVGSNVFTISVPRNDENDNGVQLWKRHSSVRVAGIPASRSLKRW